MGSYCGLLINGIELYAVKNTFSGTFLKLFSPHEFLKYTEDLDGEDYERYVFRTTVKKAKTSLEILGGWAEFRNTKAGIKMHTRVVYHESACQSG